MIWLPNHLRISLICYSLFSKKCKKKVKRIFLFPLILENLMERGNWHCHIIIFRGFKFCEKANSTQEQEKVELSCQLVTYFSAFLLHTTITIRLFIFENKSHINFFTAPINTYNLNLKNVKEVHDNEQLGISKGNICGIFWTL